MKKIQNSYKLIFSFIIPLFLFVLLLSYGNVAASSLPTVSIKATDSSIAEGSDAVFRVVRTGDTTNTLDVTVTCTQEGMFASDAALSISSVTIKSEKLFKKFSVNTIDDNIGEDPGSITCAVQESSLYDIDSENNSVGIAITNEEDHMPIVSIEGKQDLVFEGSSVTFKVVRTGEGDDIANALDVVVSCTQEGSLVSENTDLATNNITIKGEKSYRKLVFSTSDDEVGNSGERSITCVVQDNSRYYDTNFSSKKDKIIVWDDDLPTISMKAKDASVVEGSDAIFKVVRTGEGDDIANALDVVVSCTQEGTFASDTALSVSNVTIKSEKSFAKVTVPTTDNSTDEMNGSITCAVQESSSSLYHVGFGVKSRDMIYVKDNDLPDSFSSSIPVVSISVRENELFGVEFFEGDPIVIDINVESSDEDVFTDGLLFSMQCEQQGNERFLSSHYSERFLLENVSTQHGHFVFQTDDDNVVEEGGGGTISCTLLESSEERGDSSFALSSTVERVEMYVRDNDRKQGVYLRPEVKETPLRELSTNGQRRYVITEGQDAVFKITRYNRFPESLSVDVACTEEGDYTSDSQEVASFSVIIPAREYETTFSLTTDDDDADELNGSVACSIVSSANYVLQSATYSPSPIYIDDNDEVVEEGEDNDGETAEE